MYTEPAQTTDSSCEQVRERMTSTLKLVNQYSHEINNQLTIIIGRSEQTMLATREDHLLHSYFDEICQSAQRVADLTKKLLAMR